MHLLYDRVVVGGAWGQACSLERSKGREGTAEGAGYKNVPNVKRNMNTK